jgi:cell wall-associated NlpC family hydrolase
MYWTDNYIDLPFKMDGRDHDGVDCWGLVRLVYLHKGVNLPTYSGVFTSTSISALKNVSRAMALESARWRKVETPQDGDVVLLNGSGRPFHCGIVCGRTDMLHIEEGINSCVESFTGLKWKNRINGFYRYDR